MGLAMLVYLALLELAFRRLRSRWRFRRGVELVAWPPGAPFRRTEKIPEQSVWVSFVITALVAIPTGAARVDPTGWSLRVWFDFAARVCFAASGFCTSGGDCGALTVGVGRRDCAEGVDCGSDEYCRGRRYYPCSGGLGLRRCRNATPGWRWRMVAVYALAREIANGRGLAAGIVAALIPWQAKHTLALWTLWCALALGFRGSGLRYLGGGGGAGAGSSLWSSGQTIPCGRLRRLGSVSAVLERTTARKGYSMRRRCNAVMLRERFPGSHVELSLDGIVLAAGFAARERMLRLSGLTLLLLCIGKVFFFDLRNLETMYRILSFIGLGVVLLLVSWIYTRFREQLQRYL